MRRANLRRRNRLIEPLYECFVLTKIVALLVFRGRAWLQLLVLCAVIATLSFFVSRMALTSN